MNPSSIFVPLILLCLTFSSLSAPYSLPVVFDQTYSFKTNITFGSTGQKVEVILDTGSAQMIVYCQLCIFNCPSSNVYINSKSPSFGKATCGSVKSQLGLNSIFINSCLNSCIKNNSPASQSCYFSGSQGTAASGSAMIIYQLVYDNFTLPGSSMKFRSSWGCNVYSQQPSDNLMGLGLTPSYEFLNAIFQQDRQLSRSFSICLFGSESVMTIGGVSTSTKSANAVSVPVDASYPNWWSIPSKQIGNITFNKVSIKMNDSISFGPYGLIVDTGTNFFVLPDLLLLGLNAQIRQLCEDTAGTSGCRFTSLPAGYFRTQLNFSLDAWVFFNSAPLVVNMGNGTIQVPLASLFWNVVGSVYRLAVASREKQGLAYSVWGSIGMNTF